MHKNIWNWLKNSENRGALDFLLKYLLGPFSALGVGILIYTWAIQSSEFSFWIRVDAAQGMNPSVEEVSFLVQNMGSDVVYLNERFQCQGPSVNGVIGQLSVSFQSRDVVEISPEGRQRVHYDVSEVGTIAYGTQGNTPEPAPLNELFAAQSVHSTTCSLRISTLTEEEFFEFTLNASPAGNSRLQFLSSIDDFYWGHPNVPDLGDVM